MERSSSDYVFYSLMFFVMLLLLALLWQDLVITVDNKDDLTCTEAQAQAQAQACIDGLMPKTPATIP